MRLYVTQLGLSMSHIENIDRFTDMLFEKNIYYSNKNNSNRNAIENILEQIGCNELPFITVGIDKKNAQNATSILQALNMVVGDTAILCVQKGEDGLVDAAVIVVSDKVQKEAWAVITETDSAVSGEKSRLYELYNQQGPVLDAMELIESCIATKHGFDFSKSWSGEIFFDENIDENLPKKCTVSDGTILLEQIKQTSVLSLSTNKFLIPILFENECELNKGLECLIKKLNTMEIASIAYEYLSTFIENKRNNKSVVFIGSDEETFIKEINLFVEERKKWFIPNFRWSTKMGSCYTSSPIGNKAKICYINPPGGLFSKLAFYRLYRVLPELKKEVEKNRIKKKSNDPLISKYYFEIITIMLTAKSLEMLGIKQDAIIGGSLGELSIPLIFDVTVVKEQLLEGEKSSLDIMYDIIRILEELLASQKKLSQVYFKKEIGDLEKWYLVCDSQAVQERIDKFPDHSPIFLTIIGSPRDVIICGTHELCEQVISELHCYALQFKDPIYAHTPVLEPMSNILKERISEKEIHLAENLDFDIYSTSRLEVMDESINKFAENFSDCLIKQVNMPDILKKSYKDGCNVYFDLGSSMLCSRWAKETFKNYDNVLVLSLFNKSTGEESILSLLSLLMTNHINVDFSRLFNIFFSEKNILKMKVEVNKMEKKNSQVIATEEAYENNGFLEKLIVNQFNINKKIFHTYLSTEKKIADLVTDYDTVKANNLSVLEREEKERTNSYNRNCLYDYNDILEMIDGSMAKVLGPIYQGEDQFEVRARMPLPPYLFVTRILDINAKYGEFVAGSSIQAEYDVPEECILKVSPKTVSSVVFSEAAHIGIFLAGYMGIDVYSSGKSKFRITDVTTKYVSEEWPQIGDTIRMKFVIERLVRNGDMTLLFCDFKVYLGEKLIIDAKETGGFFTQQALDEGAGIIQPKEERLQLTSKVVGNNFYKPITTKRSFNENDVSCFLSGNYMKCFGVEAANSTMPYQVCEEAMFINKIIEMDNTGGRYNLGYAIAEMYIDENFWPFKSHFKNDPVLPGTIMLEGLNQTVTFFQTSMGLYNTEKPFVTKLKTGYVVKTKFRGEVKPASHVIRYRIDAKEVKQTDNGLLFVADGKVFCDGLQVIEQQNAAMIIG